jgi:hypothetical protein
MIRVRLPGDQGTKKGGNSCTESELWNSLIAPRRVASSGFSFRPGMGVGTSGRLEGKQRQVEEL